MAHVVLDLDGTLMSDAYPRPHLAEFLEYCRSHFATVSVWTAASRDWWCYCYAQYLSPFDFDRVLTDVDCDLQTGFYYGEPRVLKPLGQHWDEAATLIVDDTAHTANANPRNLILVKSWNHEENDTGLKEAQAELEKRLGWFKTTGDVRTST